MRASRSPGAHNACRRRVQVRRRVLAVFQPTAGMANRSDRIISSSFIERLDGRKILEALLEIVARRARGGGQACLSHNGSFVIRVYSRLCQAFPIQPVG